MTFIKEKLTTILNYLKIRHDNLKYIFLCYNSQSLKLRNIIYWVKLIKNS